VFFAFYYVAVHCRCPPEFISEPENKTVKIGDDAELVCRYISGEAAHVTWVKHYKVNGSYVDDEKVPHVAILQVIFVIIALMQYMMMMMMMLMTMTSVTRPTLAIPP